MSGNHLRQRSYQFITYIQSKDNMISSQAHRGLYSSIFCQLMRAWRVIDQQFNQRNSCHLSILQNCRSGSPWYLTAKPSHWCWLANHRLQDPCSRQRIVPWRWPVAPLRCFCPNQTISILSGNRWLPASLSAVTCLPASTLFSCPIYLREQPWLQDQVEFFQMDHRLQSLFADLLKLPQL